MNAFYVQYSVASFASGVGADRHRLLCVGRMHACPQCRVEKYWGRVFRIAVHASPPGAAASPHQHTTHRRSGHRDPRARTRRPGAAASPHSSARDAERSVGALLAARASPRPPCGGDPPSAGGHRRVSLGPLCERAAAGAPGGHLQLLPVPARVTHGALPHGGVHLPLPGQHGSSTGAWTPLLSPCTMCGTGSGCAARAGRCPSAAPRATRPSIAPSSVGGATCASLARAACRTGTCQTHTQRTTHTVHLVPSVVHRLLTRLHRVCDTGTCARH